MFEFDGRTRCMAMAGVSALALTISNPVCAQSAAVSAKTPKTGSSLTEDVVVTARRRSESLENVPVTVTALGATQLKQRSITTETDLQRTVPGLTIRANFNDNQLNFAIRGQTVDAFSGSRQAVVAYFNDVQIPQGASSSFFDLDSIQVLKGPQGTLFGRNATGGAVLFNSAKPKDSFGGYITAGIGDYGLYETDGAVDLPLVKDKLLLRIAFQDKVRDGYVHNLYTGQYLGGIDDRAIRATLDAKPIDGLENTTTFQYNQNDGSNAGGELYSVYACGSKNGKYALVSTAACLYSPKLGSVIGLPGAWNLFLSAHPGVPAGGIPQELQLQNGWGPWTTSLNEPEGEQARGLTVTNTTSYVITPDLSIKNVVGLGYQNNHMHTDLDGSPFPIEQNFDVLDGQDGVVFETEQYSEEFQVLGKALDEKLTYITGVYFGNQTDHNFQNFEAGNLLPIAAPQGNTSADRLINQTEGVFAQFTYDFSEWVGIHKLSFTAGGRESWDYNEIDELPGGYIYLNKGTDTERESDHKPSWQFGLEYQPSSHALFYINQRGSWRSGGFNNAAPGIDALAAEGGNKFLPETTEDVEIGAKLSGQVFDRPAHVNVDVYDQWIQNVQRATYVIIAGLLDSVTASVPAANVKGVEIEGDVSPIDWLRVGLSFSYTDARYTQGNVTIFGQSFSYNSYADTPKYTGGAFAQIYLPLAEDMGTASIRGDIYAQSLQYFSNQNFSNAPENVDSGYALINMHADWNNIYNSRYSLSAFVTNLADKKYYVGGFPSGPILGINTAVPGMPRMFGFSATARF